MSAFFAEFAAYVEIVLMSNVPCFNEEIKMAKRKRRKAEKRW